MRIYGVNNSGGLSMSHKACHWLEELPAIHCKSGAFRVLFHLCCSHNGKVPAAVACFPSQETLMGATGLSNGGVNNALNALESDGLVHRRRTRKKNGTKGPTYYILRFDFKDALEPTPDSGDGTNSSLEAKPTPVFEANQLQPTGDKPVKEPVIEPCVDEQHTHKLFQKFWKEHPRPRDEDKSHSSFLAAVKSGVDPEWMVSSAKKYATENKRNGLEYVKRSDTWLTAKRWQDFPRKIKTTGVRKMDYYADLINGQGFIPSSMISDSLAGELIASGKVTPERMRERIPT